MAIIVLGGLSLLGSVQPGSANPGHGNGWGEGDGGGRGHNGAPAPLLAAGLPAFAVVGVGAGIRFLLRRRQAPNDRK